MKVRIEIDSGLEETEVVIRCSQLDSSVVQLQSTIVDQGDAGHCIPLLSGETSYFVPLENIFFFETEGGSICAHTQDKVFEAPYKLYELEELLPAAFMRVSKSTIINLDRIYSITRNLTASSVVEFAGSSKKALVSRSYYKSLVERLNSRRLRVH